MLVCFLINGLGGSGGAERSLEALLPHYVERGVRPLVAVLKDKPEGEERARARGAEVVRLPGDSLWSWAPAFRRLVAERWPDLIYTSLFEADMVGRYGRIGRSIPVLGSLVNTYDDPTGLEKRNEPTFKRRVAETLDRLTGKVWTDHYHAVASAVRDSYVRGYGIPPEKITVVPRGRSRERFGASSEARRTDARRALGIPEGAPLLINVGRHETQKDHKTFVDAVALLRGRFPAVRAVILGREGTTTPRLREQIARHDLGDHVHLLGYRNDVPDLLAASDVFVFPSLREGAAGALLEAMAMGLPIVASDLPALREPVTPERNGLLVPPGDPAAFAEAVAALLADPARAAAYGEAARECFDANYSISRAADRMVALFRKVSAAAA